MFTKMDGFDRGPEAIAAGIDCDLKMRELVVGAFAVEIDHGALSTP